MLLSVQIVSNCIISSSAYLCLGRDHLACANADSMPIEYAHEEDCGLDGNLWNRLVDTMQRSSFQEVLILTPGIIACIAPVVRFSTLDYLRIGTTDLTCKKCFQVFSIQGLQLIRTYR